MGNKIDTNHDSNQSLDTIADESAGSSGDDVQNVSDGSVAEDAESESPTQ